MIACLPEAVSRMTVTQSKSPASPIAGSTSTAAWAETDAELFAEQEARHVEIMDRHVAEDAAGALDVIDRRRARDRAR